MNVARDVRATFDTRDWVMHEGIAIGAPKPAITTVKIGSFLTDAAFSNKNEPLFSQPQYQSSLKIYFSRLSVSIIQVVPSNDCKSFIAPSANETTVHLRPIPAIAATIPDHISIEHVPRRSAY